MEVLEQQAQIQGFFYVIPHSVSDLKEKQSDLKNKQEEILFKLCKEISHIFEKNLLFLKFINKEFDKFDHYQARIFFSKIGDKNFILPSKKDEKRLVDFCHPALVVEDLFLLIFQRVLL